MVMSCRIVANVKNCSNAPKEGFKIYQVYVILMKLQKNYLTRGVMHDC